MCVCVCVCVRACVRACVCNYVHITFTVSVPEVQVPATEKTKSKQELSRNEHLAAVKHEGEHIYLLCELFMSLAITYVHQQYYMCICSKYRTGN